MAKYKVIVADRAKVMLGMHIKFLAQVNPSEARDAKERLMTGIRSLSEMPERFSFLDDEHIPHGKYHKMCVENRYLLVYQIQDRSVYVDYVADCRQPDDKSSLLDGCV